MLCAALDEPTLQVADVKLWPPCRSAHLTNDAVQINFDHYGSFEDANKLTMEALQELFAGQVGLALAASLTQGPQVWLLPHTPHSAALCLLEPSWLSTMPGLTAGKHLTATPDRQHRQLPGMRAAQPRHKFAVSDLLPCR